MLLFDTGKKLEKAFTKEQFDALVDMLEKRDGSLATSQELADATSVLKADIALIKGDLRETELRLETKIESAKSELRSDIASAKHELLKWFIGMAVAQTGVLAALYAIMK